MEHSHTLGFIPKGACLEGTEKAQGKMQKSQGNGKTAGGFGKPTSLQESIIQK